MNLEVNLLVGFCMLFIVDVCYCQLNKAALPPRITSQPPNEISYKLGEAATLMCDADGHPPISFEWYKDGQRFAINNSRVTWTNLPKTGSIVISDPTDQDEGIYQCIARNEYGAAIGRTMLFKKAVLEPFPSIKQPRIHRPLVGTSFTLKCESPKSYPPGLVYWGENRVTTRLKPIENTARVSSDYNGNLHFANIQPEDRLNGYSYVCIVQNTPLRSLVQGDDQAIYPVNTTDMIKPEPPQLMWSSPVKTVAIRGQTLKMKCIFSGYPTPEVTWKRLDNQLSASAVHLSFGQEISISDVQFDDEGEYQCSATNEQNGASVSEKFYPIVESMPYWRQDRSPEDVNIIEDDPAHVYCNADGKPRPTVSWFINGQPIEDVPPDPRRTVSNYSISYSTVTKKDIKVVQCNASNIHGYILANIHINVLAEPPSFTRALKSLTKVAEGRNVTLTCRVYGAPKPKIFWTYSETDSDLAEEIIDNERYTQQSTGDLRIKRLLTSDGGHYTCHASNKFGNESVSGQLLVLERTVITDGPKDQNVNAGSVVIFPCNAHTDPAESANFTIEWHRNGEKIDYALRPYFEHNKLNNSLIITGVEASDSSNYSCHASNGIDSADATAQLVVRDKPDPPSSVSLSNNCTDNKAELKWTPGNDNNDKIIEYIVYYHTSHDPPDKFQIMIRVPDSSSLKSAVVNLKPWTSYSFYVAARNSIGESSKQTHGTSELTNCSTPAATPFRHPEKVCTVSRNESELVIVWQPMEQSEHNGEHFHYVVGYKQKNEKETKTREVTDWRKSEIVIRNQPTFTEYTIFVKAVNSKGEAPSSMLERRTGYSGQGIPVSKPENFTLLSMNSSSANFSWKKVDERPEEIKGFFVGYRIKFWKTGIPENVRTEDLLLKTIDPCPLLRPSPNKRETRSVDDTTVTGQTNKLWAFSSITAAVMVLNGAGHTGPLSDTIEFQTPEGVPEVVKDFEVKEKGSNHLVVAWKPPEEANGILEGYVIEYEEAPSGIVRNRIVVDPSQHTTKITGLKNDTSYVFHIRARTSVGPGPEIRFLEKTNPASVPSKPGINEIEVGDDYAVVSWQPSSEDDSTSNPGSTYCIEYRPEGSQQWRRTENTTDDSKINVTGLEKGIKYEVRVAAFNDGDSHSTSNTAIINTGPKPSGAAEPALTESYFRMIVLAAVLFLVFFIVCVLCYATYNRGEAYSVNKREKKFGFAAGKDDEPEFGEYVRPQEPYQKSKSSINSLAAKKSPEQGDSDNDSLNEYADPDPSKFAEDGSFIGQYGKKKPIKAGDAPPASYSTII